MALTVDIQYACEAEDLPAKKEFRRWITSCLQATGHRKNADHEVSIRIVDSAEITGLNNQYRHKNKPTNVLSFPAEFPEGVEVPLLGDIVICAEVVREEAQQQQKSLTAHWAHMTIHGMLHLLGYDHINDDEAMEMEALETAILLESGYPDPYIVQPVSGNTDHDNKHPATPGMKRTQ